MDILLLGVDPHVKRFLREHMAPTVSSRICFHNPSLEGEQIPRQGRWDLIVIDRKVKAHSEVAQAIKTNKIEGLKIVLTEPENLHSEIEFWGTGIYSYFLKPINRQLFQRVWQNALERIQLDRKLSRLQRQKKRQRTTVVQHQEILKDLVMAHLKMQELEQGKTKFLAQTAHELRTPLTALKGYLSLMASEKGGSVSPLQYQLLNRSLHSCRRLLRLTQSLLDLSALGGHSACLPLEKGDMQECLRRAAEELHSAAAAKSLQLILDDAANLPLLRFDFDRMQQVFANLLENAVKFTPEGGKIHVRCGPYFWERRTVREMLYTTRERRNGNHSTTFNSVRVEVEDTGVGIAPEFLPEIFQEYCRGANGNGSSKGFGLGLAVAQQIMAAHEGKIWAESEPSSGSRFTVLIPTGL